MQIQIDDRPSYAMAKVALDPGEEIVAEGGAMVAMTEGFEWETKARRGFLKPIARSTFGGEDEGSVATTTDLQPMWLEQAGLPAWGTIVTDGRAETPRPPPKRGPLVGRLGLEPRTY